MKFPRTSVLTIQGGGAVAIDLIGQLQGLTGERFLPDGSPTADRGLVPAAVAGTSAGAIIATLYWAGYSPEAIRDEVVHLFAPPRVNRFFGRGGVRLLPIWFSGFAALAEAAEAASRGILPLLARIFIPKRWWLFLVAWAWNLVRLLYALVATTAALTMRRGIFPGDGMVAEIDRLLRESPLFKPCAGQLPPGGSLRFYDIANSGSSGAPLGPPLFLIVTSVRASREIVVSSIDTGWHNQEIAHAVRASAGFPGFFLPVALTDMDSAFDCCVDGGVVSNFPAWVFSRDYRKSLRQSGIPLLREISYLPWLHVGLRLPQSGGPSPEHFNGFVRGLWRLLSGQGRARLEEKLAAVAVKRRTVNPARPPPGEAPQGVLDFGALANSILVADAFKRGRINGQQAIEQGCFDLPDGGAIEALLVELAECAGFILRDWMLPGTKIRANVIVPTEIGRLEVAYHVNMSGDPDEHIAFAHGEGIVSLVLAQCIVVVADLGAGTFAGGAASGGGDPFLRRPGAPRILPDRTWLISVPIIDVAEMWPVQPDRVTTPLALSMDGPVIGVISVDAALDLFCPDSPTPKAAAGHPAILALSDCMQSVGMKCSVALNRSFLKVANVGIQTGAGATARS